MPLAFNRTIESPGVEIRELDYTLNVGLPVGTNVMVAGYSQQGPTDELLNITSISEFEQIFGVPNDPAEQYFYHTCRQTLLKNGNLIATRLPYGSGEGAGFGSQYSALVYPVYAAPTSATQVTVLTGVGASNYYTTGANILDNYKIFDNCLYTVGSIENAPYSYTITGSNSLLSANEDPVFWLSGSPAWVAVSAFYGPRAKYVESTLTSSFSAGPTSWTQIWDIAGQTFSVKASGINGFYTQYQTASSYIIGEPTQLNLTDYEYDLLTNGGVAWSDLASIPSANKSKFDFDSIGKAGIVIVNKAKRTTNELYEGQYVILADNSKIGFGTDYDNVRGYKTVTKYASANTCNWSELSPSVLNFNLTGTYMASTGTTSEVIESIPSYEFGSPDFNDSLIIGVLKLRTTQYANDGKTTTLDQLLIESYIGSLWSKRQIQNRNGGPMETFFIEEIVKNKSNDIMVMVNDNISKKSDDWLNSENEIIKRVGVYAPARNENVFSVPVDDSKLKVVMSTYAGGTNISTSCNVVNSFAKHADYGYAVGPWTNRSLTSAKMIGELPKKLERALRLAENVDEINVDILCDAGLSTIETFRQVAQLMTSQAYANHPYAPLYADWKGDYRDDLYLPGVQTYLNNTAKTDRLIDQDYGNNNNAVTGRDSTVANEYQKMFQKFAVFCEFTRRPGTLFISDPLRHIFVQGQRSVLACTVPGSNERHNFPQHIYWGLRNLYAEANTSYACTYANWVKAFDASTDRMWYLPFSGFATGIMCDTDRNYFPWFAPAGLNRGRITDVVEIAINPVLKQRDLLYRHGLNPVCFFPQDGFVIWGQKTLFKKPSAFDRINVRRLFLILQKATVAAARYFVFEPNTVFTRTRVVDTLKPIFERAKNNEGLYDYLIICDERNNTPDVIDRNELAVDIYLKPVRAAEFILISFIATRTGQDFSELI